MDDRRPLRGKQRPVGGHKHGPHQRSPHKTVWGERPVPPRRNLAIPHPLSLSSHQILYGSLDNLSHLHLETARRTASLASELDVALAVLLEDRYEAFRAAVAEHERAQRAAAAQRLWGSDAPDAHGAAALAGRPPAREQQYPSPLAGLTPEARAAVVADRLATLGSAIGALVVSSWVVGSGAAAPCVPAAAQPRQVLALPLPEGAACVSLGEADGGDAEQPVAGPLWRRLAWAAGALRGKM